MSMAVSNRADLADAAAPNTAPDQRSQSNVRRLRLLQRRKVSMPAFLKFEGGAFAVEIRNISTGGAGCTLSAPMSFGQSITLHLLDGRELTGTLQWQRMGFAGIEFASALQSDDPLLTTADNSTPQATLTTNVPQVVAKVLSFAASVSGTLHDRRKRGNDHKMLEAACRKQGFSWLADEEDSPSPKLG